MTTHTLEGNDLEALLARVPTELGPDATIVAANKLRTGGLAGFFAKERYEVVVEVSDAPAPGVAAEPGRPLAGDGGPRLSTDEIGFAGVLDRMVRDAGGADSGPRPVGPGTSRLVAAPPPDDAEDLDLAFQPLAPTRLTSAEPTPPTSELGHGVALADGGTSTTTPTPSGLPPHGAGADVHGGPSAIAVAPTRAVVAGPALDQWALARVGLPSNVADLLPLGGGSDPTVALYQLMDRLALPEALPAMPGSVIAVVGERREAMVVLERFAAQLGTDTEDIVVAACRRTAGVAEEQRLATPEQACEGRRSWRRRRRPTLVVVEAGVTRHGRPWAREVLDALEPTMVWGVVEAQRKSEDVREWADRLGGLDALAVTGLRDTVSPAAILGAGIPVGLLDDEEATAARWTAILAERLELAA